MLKFCKELIQIDQGYYFWLSPTLPMNECKNSSGGTAEWNNEITLLGFCREWQTGKLCPMNEWCVSEVATVTLQLPDL